MTEKDIPKRFPWESWRRGFSRRRAWKKNPDSIDVIKCLLEAYVRDDQDTFESIASFGKEANVPVQDGLLRIYADPLPLQFTFPVGKSTSEFCAFLAAKNLISSADLPTLQSDLRGVAHKFEESFWVGNWDDAVKYGEKVLHFEERLGRNKDARCTSCKLNFAKSFGSNQLMFRELQPERVLGGRCSNRFEKSMSSPYSLGKPKCISHSSLILNPTPELPLRSIPFDVDKNFRLMNAMLDGSIESSFATYYTLLFECYVSATEKQYTETAFVSNLCCKYLSLLPECKKAADLSLHFSRLRDSCLYQLPNAKSEKLIESDKPIEKLSCKKCGAKIMPSTAEKTNGLCMPCWKR